MNVFNSQAAASAGERFGLFGVAEKLLRRVFISSRAETKAGDRDGPTKQEHN
jgi:hypothetical protein